MAYNGYDYRAWLQTPEGKAYYDKYLADIPGINEDENTIKNAFYGWVNTTYEVQDKVTETASNIITGAKNTFWNMLLIVAIGAFLYYNYKKGKL